MADKTINQLAEDSSPTSDDYIAAWDVSTGTTKKVSLANLPDGFSSGSLASEKLGATIACRAYRDAAWTLGAGEAKVVLDVENYDVGSDFATGTFTAPVTGYYQVNASVGINNLADGSQVLAKIKANGSTVSVASGASSAASIDPYVGVADLVYVAAGQTIELWADATTGGTTGATGTIVTFISIYFVGA